MSKRPYRVEQDIHTNGRNGGPSGGRAPKAIGPGPDAYSIIADALGFATSDPEEVRSWSEEISSTVALALGWETYRSLSLGPRRIPACAGELVQKLRAWVEWTLPRGVVTLLLADVEGSTWMWDHHPAKTATALERLREIVSDIVDGHGGVLPRDQGEGDSFVAVFDKASDGIECALDLQRAFLAEPWPKCAELRVRFGVHTGEAEMRDGRYYGAELNRCARLRSLAHGAQVLVSRSTYEVVKNRLPEGTALRSMGSQHLRGLSSREELFQLLHVDLPSEFPPLRHDPNAVSKVTIANGSNQPGTRAQSEEV